MSKKSEAKQEPEATEERQDHWLNDQPSRNSFWAQAGVLGLPKEEVHRALGYIESVYDFKGTLEEALNVLTKYAASQSGMLEGSEVAEEPLDNSPESYAASLARVEASEPLPLLDHTERLRDLPEAPASINFFGSTAGGWNVQVTLRDYDETSLVERFAALVKALKEKQVFPVNRYGDPILPQSATKPPEAPNGAAPPPPPPGAPPAPPRSTGAVALRPNLENSDQEHQENIDYIKIAATEDGKPIIQFWRSQRKYPELKYNLSAKLFFENVRGANWFLENGYKQAHFEAVSIGRVYQLPMHVYWVKSPKSPQGKVWKDIVAVVIK